MPPPLVPLAFKFALEILLESGEKNNWKLKVLDCIPRETFLGILVRFLNFAKDTLEELSCKMLPSEEISQCLKLRKLYVDIRRYGSRYNLNTLGPLLQPSQLSLVELHIDLVDVSQIVAILKRFRNTLQELYCTALGTISLNELLNEFEETAEPVQEPLSIFMVE